MDKPPDYYRQESLRQALAASSKPVKKKIEPAPRASKPGTDAFDNTNALAFVHPKRRRPPKRKSRQKLVFTRLTALSPEYHAHINSAKWRSFKASVVAERGKKCQRCGTKTKKLELHHIHYRNFGNEAPDDVELLCNICHAREHQRRQKL